jgi:hypothetical protein
MKKSISIIVVLIIIGSVAWFFTRGNDSVKESVTNAGGTISVNPTSMTKVTDLISMYRNDELGFSVQYPTAWTSEASASGVLFGIPTGAAVAGENTMNKLQVNIDVVPGTCAFPQVTTIAERDTIKVNDIAFNMIAMKNSVQGRQYFNRMYSTPKGSVCYMFNFASIATNPSSKGFTADKLDKVNLANKNLADAADAAFQKLVKSFAYVTTPDGENEALHSSKK